MSCCPPAGLYNITADQGATFSRSITWKDSAKKVINITGYTARMHVRTTASAPTTVLELTTENDRIEIIGAQGKITLTVDASDMSDIEPDKYVYDLEIEAPVTGVVHRIIQGNFVVRPEVTR
jgi:hypothetical protein